jgi:hypothetical protein
MREGGATLVRSLLVVLTPSCVYLGVLAILGALFYWLGSRRNSSGSSLTRDFLRGPGDSLLKRIEDLNHDIGCYAATIVVTPLFLCFSYVSGLHFGITKEGAIICGLSWIAVIPFLVAKLRKLLNERRCLSARRRAGRGMGIE